MDLKFDLEQCKARFKEVYTAPNALGASRAKIIKALQTVDLMGWSTHEESGRLDRRAFTRFAVGSTSVFSRRTYTEAETSAVSILLDCSGSMKDELGVAQETIVQLAKILEKTSASYAVTGFTGMEGLIDDDTRWQEPWFIPFKGWNESLPRAAAKLGSIDLCSLESTPDYAAVSIAIDELARRDEGKKILILITDAAEYTVEHMQYLQACADKRKVKIVAIGINAHGVVDCFTNAANISSVGQLASASFGKVLAAV